ncbi:MAG: Fe-S cluster assembly protein SufB, partial [Pseudomonadales bacterium]|nr:Fe-S cluster assembly protein SufB [Pseudomonadales bacterium]
MASTDDNSLDGLVDREYAAGFVTDIEADTLPPGLDEDVIRFISARKNEPEWLTQWRLDAYHGWLEMVEPSWGQVQFPAIDYQSISYYSAPSGDRPKTLEDVDPELLATYDKLGIPLHEQAALAGVSEPEQAPTVAVDAVFDSVSIGTTFKEELRKAGVIFCSFSEAVHDHPDLIRRYLGSVVPRGDNFFAALNSAVFSDGSFVYIPENTRCPMELSTYFRINERNTGQFERTLIIAEPGAYVSYLEGCTAPMR